MQETERKRVTIAGREFEVGAVYAPCGRRGRVRPRKLVAFDPSVAWRGGKVVTRTIASEANRPGIIVSVSGTWWMRWAGERIAGE